MSIQGLSCRYLWYPRVPAEPAQIKPFRSHFSAGAGGCQVFGRILGRFGHTRYLRWYLCPMPKRPWPGPGVIQKGCGASTGEQCRMQQLTIQIDVVSDTSLFLPVDLTGLSRRWLTHTVYETKEGSAYIGWLRSVGLGWA